MVVLHGNLSVVECVLIVTFHHIAVLHVLLAVDNDTFGDYRHRESIDFAHTHILTLSVLASCKSLKIVAHALLVLALASVERKVVYDIALFITSDHSLISSEVLFHPCNNGLVARDVVNG